ncbi:MAG: polysaccharide deacetylase family protein [Armatimonadota bacterium]
MPPKTSRPRKPTASPSRSGSRPASRPPGSSGGGIGGTLALGLAVAVLGSTAGVLAQRWVSPSPAVKKAGGPVERSRTASRETRRAAAERPAVGRRTEPNPKPAEKPAEPEAKTPEAQQPESPAEAPARKEEASLLPAAAPTEYPAMEIERGAGARPEVALTFDAGADWKPAKQILDTLAAEGVKTTFFLTGEWVRQNPKTSQRIADEGHEIGNHSWDHPAFTKLTEEQIRDQLARTETQIQQATGRTSRPYFRPPLGARDRRVLREVGKSGYLSIYWTLDSRDSVDRGITAAQIRDRVLGKIGPGSIVLLHCGSQASADALPEILRGLRERGLKPVTVGRLLAD